MCTTDMSDTVDGALFTIGPTGTPALFGDFTGAFDLDTLDVGDGLDSSSVPGTAVDGYGSNMVSAGVTVDATVVVDSITMTVSVQAITGGVLEFYVLYRPLSADGAITLGAGMVAI